MATIDTEELKPLLANVMPIRQAWYAAVDALPKDGEASP
jgi:hypothetical protein